MAYSQKVMDHFANPRNTGEIPDANGVGEVGNAVCGDIMKMYLKINDQKIIEGRQIQDVRLRRRRRHFLDSHRDDKGQERRRRPQAHQ